MLCNMYIKIYNNITWLINLLSIRNIEKVFKEILI